MLAKDHFYLIITLLTGILSFIKHMKFDFKCPEDIGVVINIIEMHPFDKSNHILNIILTQDIQL